MKTIHAEIIIQNRIITKQKSSKVPQRNLHKKSITLQRIERTQCVGTVIKLATDLTIVLIRGTYFVLNAEQKM